MAKRRLYDADHERRDGAHYALYRALLTTLKLFAPLLPYVTDEIYRGVFAGTDGAESIHCATWPAVDRDLLDEQADALGDVLVAIATGVRRYKSDQGMSLGAELAQLQVAPADASLRPALAEAHPDLESVTRAQRISVRDRLDPELETVSTDGVVAIALRP